MLQTGSTVPAPFKLAHRLGLTAVSLAAVFGLLASSFWPDFKPAYAQVKVDSEGILAPSGNLTRYAKDRIVVEFKSDQNPQQIQAQAQKDTQILQAPLAQPLQYGLKQAEYTINGFIGRPTAVQIANQLTEAQVKEKVAGISPTYQLSGQSSGTTFTVTGPSRSFNVQSALQTFAKLTNVKSVRPVALVYTDAQAEVKNAAKIEVKAEAIPNDPLFPDQWGLSKIQASQAWDSDTGANAPAVAILDSGVDFKHEDLFGKVLNPDQGEINPDPNQRSFTANEYDFTSCPDIEDGFCQFPRFVPATITGLTLTDPPAAWIPNSRIGAKVYVFWDIQDESHFHVAGGIVNSNTANTLTVKAWEIPEDDNHHPFYPPPQGTVQYQTAGKTSVMDNYGHGTHVAGIVAAVSDNYKGIAGTATGTKILAVKILSDSGAGYDTDIEDALYYLAAHKPYGIKVLNLSVGSILKEAIHPDDRNDPNYWDQKDIDAYKDAVTAAKNAGLILVAAAGNCGRPPPPHSQCHYQNEHEYPASFAMDNLLFTVGSTDRDDGRSNFSTAPLLNPDNWQGNPVYSQSKFANYLTLSAPGRAILSLRAHDNNISGPFQGHDAYTLLSGTSMATPQVAGAVALLLSAKPALNFEQIKKVLTESSDKLWQINNITNVTDPELGAGRLNLLRAITNPLVLPELTATPLPTSTPLPTATPFPSITLTPSPTAPNQASGVLATFQVSNETFKVWVTNSSAIQDLYDLWQKKNNKDIPYAPVRKGPGFNNHNAPWSWYLDPKEIVMTDYAVEICDGVPSYIEDNLDNWIKNVGYYCPWGAKLIALEPLPTGPFPQPTLTSVPSQPPTVTSAPSETPMPPSPSVTPRVTSMPTPTVTPVPPTATPRPPTNTPVPTITSAPSPTITSIPPSPSPSSYPGAFGNAASFNSSNPNNQTYVRITSANNLAAFPNLTMEALVRFRERPGSRGYPILSKRIIGGASPDVFSLLWEITPTHHLHLIYSILYQGRWAPVEVTSIGTVTPDVWTPVAVVYNQVPGSSEFGKLSLYINGTRDSMTDQTGEIIGGNLQSYLVGADPSLNDFFNGEIDELRLSALPKYLGPSYSYTQPLTAENAYMLFDFNESSGDPTGRSANGSYVHTTSRNVTYVPDTFQGLTAPTGISVTSTPAPEPTGSPNPSPTPPPIFNVPPGTAGTILFTADNGSGNQDIFMINADGSGLRPLSDTFVTSEESASFLPSHSRLVYGGREGNQTNVIAMNTDSTNIDILTQDNVSSEPATTPDGRIVFVNRAFNLLGSNSQSQPSQLTIMDADGSNQHLIEVGGENPEPTVQNPAVSPDGARIVFASNADREKNMEIYSIRTDSHDLNRHTISDRTDSHPLYTKDGQQIIFQSEETGHPNSADLLVMDATSHDSNVHQLIDPAIYPAFPKRNPSLSPDGTKVLFIGKYDTAGEQFFIYDLSLKQLYRLPVEVTVGTLTSTNAWVDKIQTPLKPVTFETLTCGTNYNPQDNTIDVTATWSEPTTKDVLNYHLQVADTDNQWYFNTWTGTNVPSFTVKVAAGKTVAARVAWTNDQYFQNISQFSNVLTQHCEAMPTVSLTPVAPTSTSTTTPVPPTTTPSPLLEPSTTDVKLTLIKNPDGTGAKMKALTITGRGAAGWQLVNNQDATYQEFGSDALAHIPAQGFGFIEASGGIINGSTATISAFVNNNRNDGTYRGSYTLQAIRLEAAPVDVAVIKYEFTVLHGDPVISPLATNTPVPPTPTFAPPPAPELVDLSVSDNPLTVTYGWNVPTDNTNPDRYIFWFQISNSQVINNDLSSSDYGNFDCTLGTVPGGKSCPGSENVTGPTNTWVSQPITQITNLSCGTTYYAHLRTLDKTTGKQSSWSTNPATSRPFHSVTTTACSTNTPVPPTTTPLLTITPPPTGTPPPIATPIPPTVTPIPPTSTPTPSAGLDVSTTNVDLTLVKDPDPNNFTLQNALTITGTGAMGWELRNNQDATRETPNGVAARVIVQGFGFYESSGGISTGQNIIVRAYAHPNTAAGIYQGSYTLLALPRNNAVATIHYRLTITEPAVTLSPIPPTATPASCTVPQLPPNFAGQMAVALNQDGTYTFSWPAVAGATHYAIRIDDTTTPWCDQSPPPQNNFCYNPPNATKNPGDYMEDNLLTNSYTAHQSTRVLQIGHTYSWWIHPLNNCSGWSQIARTNFAVPVPATPVVSPIITATTTPTLIPPLAPTNTLARCITYAGNNYAIRIDWTDNSPEASRFEVRRDVNGTPDTQWIQQTQGALNRSTMVDYSIVTTNRYRYRVYACADMACTIISLPTSGAVTQEVSCAAPTSTPPMPTHTAGPTVTLTPKPTNTPIPTNPPTKSPTQVAATKAPTATPIPRYTYSDYQAALVHFGQTGPNLSGDVNQDGKVDIFDLNTIISNFQTGP